MSTFDGSGPPLSPPDWPPSDSPATVSEADPEARGAHSRAFRALAGSGIAILVAGGVAAAVLAFGFIRGTADSIVTLAPSDAVVYANLNLQPSGGQQLALNGILGKFPGLSGTSRDASINHWLDSGMQAAGLTHLDVRSWLGSQLSLIVLKSSDGITPAEVSLLASTNDAAAEAMFAKYQSGPLGRMERWTVATYDDVTVHVGDDSSGGTQVWAVTAHTVVAGTSESAVDEVIDTSQGKHASLTSDTDYTRVQAQLPSDRVAFVYVDAPRLRELIPSAAAAGAASALRGYEGIGEAMVASSSGITVTGTVDFDAAKLSAAARAALRGTAHTNGALTYIPENALGFVTLAGLPQMLKGLVTLAGPNLGASGSQALDQLGITGSSGIISHLTGDAGVEVEMTPGAQVPSGALLIATDSSNAVSSFLDQLAHTICSGSAACSSTAATRQTYQGVVISTIDVPGATSSELSPSWAVDNGWAIIASTPAEVRAVIDARRGSNITTSQPYRAVAGQLGTSNTGMFYLNVRAVVAAVRAVLPADSRATFDQQVAPYLSPVQALGVSSHAFSDHITTSEFALIG